MKEALRAQRDLDILDIEANGLYQDGKCVFTSSDIREMKDSNNNRYLRILLMYFEHRGIGKAPNDPPVNPLFDTIKFNELKVVEPFSTISTVDIAMRNGGNFGVSYDKAYLRSVFLPELIDNMVRITERDVPYETKISQMQEVVEKLFGPSCITQEEKDRLRETSRDVSRGLVQLSTVMGLDNSSFVGQLIAIITKFIQGIWKRDVGFISEIHEEDLRLAVTRAMTLKVGDQTEFAKDITFLANTFGLEHKQMVEGSKIKVEGQQTPESIKRMAGAFDSLIEQNKQGPNKDDKKIAILEKIGALYQNASDRFSEEKDAVKKSKEENDPIKSQDILTDARNKKSQDILTSIGKLETDGEGVVYIPQAWHSPKTWCDDASSHTIGIVVTPDKVGIINRGATGTMMGDLMSDSGVVWYNKPADIANMIDGIANDRNREIGQNKTSLDNYLKFVDKLGRPISGITASHSAQKTGDCTLASHKPLVEAAYTELKMQEVEKEYKQSHQGQGMSKEEKAAERKVIAAEAKVIYKEWTEHLRGHTIDDFCTKYENSTGVQHNQYKEILMMAAAKELEVDTKKHRGIISSRSGSGKANENYEKIRNHLGMNEAEMKSAVLEYDPKRAQVIGIKA